MEKLLDDEFVEIGTSGRAYDRNRIIASLANERAAHHEAREFQFRWLSDDIVLVMYRATRSDIPIGAESHSLRSSLWQWRNGAWKMVFHQGTLVPPSVM